MAPEHTKPIVGFEEFEYQRFAFESGVLSRVDVPGPPRFGVLSVTLVVCNQLAVVRLDTGEIKRGHVRSHTAPCASGFRLTDERIWAILAEELGDRGFGLPNPM